MKFTTRPINHTGRPSWRYVPASQTDIRATLRRAAKALEAAKQEREAVVAKRQIKKG